MRHLAPVGAKVLIACADAAKRRMMADGLAQDGYARVEQAASGLQVVQRIAIDKPDLVIADTHLRGWNGLDLIRGLRGSSWEVPLILILDEDDDESARLASELGAPCIFREPFALEDLRTVAVASLRCRRLGRLGWGIWNEALRHAPPRTATGART